MAKRDKLGGLGKKPAPHTETIERGGLRFVVPSLRDDHYGTRLEAFRVSANALQPLNRVERTQVVAALAEFFQLSLTVENHT